MALIVGIDPGKRNYGLSVIDLSGGIEVLETLDMSKYFDGGNELSGNQTLQQKIYNEFHDYWLKWIKKHQPLSITVERFQARGIKGNVGEYVSLMIGSILLNKTTPTFTIIPSQWKTFYNKEMAKEGNAKGLNLIYEKYPKIKSHEIDATFIAVYGYNRYLNPESKIQLSTLMEWLNVYKS
jgi:Holliday junction resolvasome RuvABC endonuclease subunit